MNEKFEAWLNGVMTVMAHTDFQMNFYWSSSDRSSHVEFMMGDKKESIIIPDDEYDWNLSRMAVRTLFEKFLEVCKNSF